MKLFSNKGKFNVYLVFLVLAISTSIVGKLTSVYDKDILFKLTPVNQPDDKFIFNQSHDSVLLKIRGYGFNLAKYYFNTPELNISVKKLKETKNTFLWNQRDNFTQTKFDFDSSVELLTISEDSIYFFFDQYISVKKAIKLNLDINYDEGYENFKAPTIKPDSILVTGPKDLVFDLEYIETDSIEFNNINSDIFSGISLKNPDLKNMSLSSNKIEYTLEVDKYTEEIIKVPVNVLSNNNIRFNYYPKELSIRYIISINDYIKLNPMDFRVDCKYDETKSTNFLIPEITKKPVFVKNTRLSKSQIQLIILE